MGIEENKEVVRIFTERWGRGDSSVFDELTTDNFIMHVLTGDGFDIDTDYLKQTNDMGHVGFPDYYLTINDMIAENDKVMVIATRTGTNTGEFLGIPPTGNKVKIFRVAMCRLENGRVAEMWGMDDYLSQFQQLGVLPSREEFIQAYKDSH
jgi:predicted ester cyclase